MNQGCESEGTVKTGAAKSDGPWSSPRCEILRCEPSPDVAVLIRVTSQARTSDVAGLDVANLNVRMNQRMSSDVDTSIVANTKETPERSSLRMVGGWCSCGSYPFM